MLNCKAHMYIEKERLAFNKGTMETEQLLPSYHAGGDASAMGNGTLWESPALSGPNYSQSS